MNYMLWIIVHPLSEQTTLFLVFPKQSATAYTEQPVQASHAMILLSRQESVLRDRTFERHHLLPSSEPVAVVARDLGDVQLLARLDELLSNPPSGLLFASNKQLKFRE